MSHTPGPWVCTGQRIATQASPDLTIAYVGVAFDGGFTEANARLIAAAPDLLAVCEELEESASYWSEYEVPIGIVERLRTAIKKARGES